MSKSNKALIAIITVLVITMLFNLLDQRPRIYKPGEHELSGNLFTRALGLSRRHPPYAAKEKSILKQLGTTVAMYYVDGFNNNYPENPQNFDIDLSVFDARHLRKTDKELPKAWQIPDNWHDFNQAPTPYVFVANMDTEYIGDSQKLIFLIKYGYNAYPQIYQAVFEDGHVDNIPEKDAIELWKKAGVWNE